MSREERDEMATILFGRMLNRRPVWINSQVGQMVWIQTIGLDHDGNDHPCEDYLLAPRSAR